MNKNIEKLRSINKDVGLIKDIIPAGVISDNQTFDYYNNLLINYLKSFFNQRKNKYIDDYESKITYRRDESLSDIEGYIKKTGFGNGIISVSVGVSTNNNPYLIPSVIHEKIHAFQILNKNEVSEVLPNFFEILLSKEFDNSYKNLFLNDLSFKIKGLKAQSNHSVKKTLFKDYGALEDAKKVEEFYLSINMLLKYIEDEEYVKHLLENNLFSTDSIENIKSLVPTYENYKISDKIKIIKRSL